MVQRLVMGIVKYGNVSPMIDWHGRAGESSGCLTELTLGASDAKYIFDPQMPPKFPIEMSSAIPTALLELGARLFPTRHTMQMNGLYNPAATRNKKKYVTPGNLG
jgi:hypothetical protein